MRRYRRCWNNRYRLIADTAYGADKTDIRDRIDTGNTTAGTTTSCNNTVGHARAGNTTQETWQWRTFSR
jgi:hypothetical protein